MNESLKRARSHLTEEQSQDLHGVLDDFFSNFGLQDIQALLWRWFVAAMSSASGAYNTGFARSNLVFVYEKLHLLIAAVHEINRRRKMSRNQQNRPARTQQ